ncbi:MAG: protein phosphatase CheZ [Rhodocyclaceae bacterium]|nr:protein phosphatase CheZ [Rhodocyclaceae bacterium]
MSVPINLTEEGDSADLQALFDSIATAAPPVSAAYPDPNTSGDSDELQALFDTVVSHVSAPVEDALKTMAPASPSPVDDDEAVFNRLGQMTRRLHDDLRDLGYDKTLKDVAQQIPDTQARLSYVAQMTEQAASRVLNAADIVSPIHAELSSRSTDLAARWDKMFANQLSVEEFKTLAANSGAFFRNCPVMLSTAQAQMTEIMLAQDFQDLTGQVLRKVADIVQVMESQLLKVLIDAVPEDKKQAVDTLMNGPVISSAGRNDVVTTQEQVDDLLDSLGF